MNSPIPPTDAQLRRAVSTAYYAVFHTTLRAAADRFVGPNQVASPAYSILYRGFDHGNMQKVCEELRKSTLKSQYSRTLGRTAVSPDMQAFAEAFPELLTMRHLADYDPSTPFLPSDMAAFIQLSQDAIDAFHRAPPAGRADVLALLMMGARA